MSQPSSYVKCLLRDCPVGTYFVLFRTGDVYKLDRIELSPWNGKRYWCFNVFSNIMQKLVYNSRVTTVPPPQ
jgi:hypothetical protein